MISRLNEVKIGSYEGLPEFKIESYEGFRSSTLSVKDDLLNSIKNLSLNSTEVQRKNSKQILRALLLKRYSCDQSTTFLLLKTAGKVCGYLIAQKKKESKNPPTEEFSYVVVANDRNQKEKLINAHQERIKHRKNVEDILSRANKKNDEFYYSKWNKDLYCKFTEKLRKYKNFQKEAKKLTHSSVGSASIKEFRLRVGDAFQAYDVRCKNFALDFYSLFDSSSGNATASFISKTLPSLITDRFKNLNIHQVYSNQLIIEYFKKAFELTEKLFKEENSPITLKNKDRAVENLKDSFMITACAAIKIGSTLWVVSVGDSKAILVRSNGQIALTDNVAHFPNDFKQINCLNPLPEVVDYSIKENDHILILASKGFWDACSVNQCGKLVRECLFRGLEKEVDIAGMLVKVAHDVQKKARKIIKLELIDAEITLIVINLK